MANIGVILAARLCQVGIVDEANLREVVAAYCRIKPNYPDIALPLCYYLYAFDGALHDRHWNAIGEQRKQQLRQQRRQWQMISKES